jgi:hypothetical protein
MRRLKHLIKVFAVHTLILSLVQTSFIFSAQAADVTGKDILSVANIALGTYGAFLGQKQQMIQQQIMAQKNAALMQKLSPSCKNADGTYCYQAAGKYFPECPLPATMATMPQNVCSETIPDPAQSAMQISSMITYESIAKGWVNYYDQMSNEATNATYPSGLKCLTDKTKKIDSEIIEMINNLTRLQDQLNKDKETFKANNKKLLEQLSQTNDELMGASKNNLDIKTNAFAKYFSSSCQSVIGEEGLAKGSQIGLLAIQQSIAPANKRAADYNQNRTAIEAEVRADVTRIQNSIASTGLQDYFDGKNTESSKFQSLGVAAKKQAQEFQLAKDRIAKELSKIGYDLPTMDKNFSVDFGEFLSESKNFFKKTYINNCVTGADKSGIAISTDQILNNLQQRSTGSSGTARDKYRAALQNILNSDAFIEDKLTQIRALEETYKDISITYQSSNGQKVTETPYDLYVKTLEKCEQRYTQDDSNTAHGSNGVSQQKKVERGQALLRELKGLHDNYASNLGTKVLEQVLSCNGETKKSGATCGTAESFDHTGASFCMNHASQCANEVNGCYAEATNQVETRKAKMNALAKTFNANAETMVNRSNQLYNAQKANVMEMVKLIQGRFPGTNFTIPENMFISMPELKKDTYGVDLAADGSMAFMDDLPKKIDSLKKIFKDQQAKVDAEIDDYIGKQKAAMSSQKERWGQLASECKSQISSVTKDLAKYNSEGQKKQAEQDAKTGMFCKKYADMAENPLGACNGADKLAEEADQISARLTNDALKYTGKFRNVCNMYNNDSKDAIPDYCLDEEAYSKLSIQKKNLCKAQEAAEAKRINASLGTDTKKSRRSKISFDSLCKGQSGLKSDKDFIAAAAEKMSAEDKELLKDAKSLKDVMAKIDNLDDSTADFFDGIASYKTDKDDNKSVCSQMESIAKFDMGDYPTETSKLKDYGNENKKKYEDEIAAKVAEKDKLAAGADTTAITKQIEELKGKKDDNYANTEKARKKIELNNVFASLTPPTPTKEEAKVTELSRLGQQVDGTCDAQASNTNTGKNFGASLLQSFDAAILGTAK